MMLLSFPRTTTVHGWQYVVDGPTFVERLGWFAVLVLAVGFAVKVGHVVLIDEDHR